MKSFLTKAFVGMRVTFSLTMTMTMTMNVFATPAPLEECLGHAQVYGQRSAEGYCLEKLGLPFEQWAFPIPAECALYEQKMIQYCQDTFRLSAYNAHDFIFIRMSNPPSNDSCREFMGGRYHQEYATYIQASCSFEEFFARNPGPTASNDLTQNCVHTKTKLSGQNGSLIMVKNSCQIPIQVSLLDINWELNLRPSDKGVHTLKTYLPAKSDYEAVYRVERNLPGRDWDFKYLFTFAGINPDASLGVVHQCSYWADQPHVFEALCK
jgi:hypothetical protein